MSQRKRIFLSSLRYRVFSLCCSVVILASLLLTRSGEAQAQGGLTLSNGSVVAGTVTDQAPLVLYNFTGKTGDLISLQVIGTTPGMNPTLSLMNPSRQQIAGNNSDPYSPVGLTGARISYLLPGDGIYTVLVGGTNGDFLLRFGSRQAGPTTGLTLNSPGVTNLLPGAAPQLYVLSVNPGDGITLTFSTTSAGFSFAAQVFDGTGQLVGMVGGTTVQTESLTVCANTNVYEILVGAAHPQMQGAVSVLATADRSGVCQGAGNQTAAGAPTLVPMGSTTQPPTNVCSATSVKDFDVNLRRGPSTFFGIAGQLGPHASVVVSGRSADNNWYVTQQNGANVWVAANVVALNGPCGNMPVMQSPPPPFTFTPPPTATPIVIIITATRRRPTSTPQVVTSTPFVVTQTPIIITQTPVVITATPAPPTLTPTP